MSHRRRSVGILLLILAPLSLVLSAGYAYNPTACNASPSERQLLGLHCSTAPPHWGWVLAVVFLVAGIATLAPWWLRWLAGKPTS
jgi:hypothetical protein